MFTMRIGPAAVLRRRRRHEVTMLFYPFVWGYARARGQG
jgi:hypothetical protein